MEGKGVRMHVYGSVHVGHGMRFDLVVDGEARQGKLVQAGMYLTCHGMYSMYSMYSMYRTRHAPCPMFLPQPE